jgi:hypothetical protein
LKEALVLILLLEPWWYGQTCRSHWEICHGNVAGNVHGETLLELLRRQGQLNIA